MPVQVRRESKDHATLSDLYLNNVISRLTHISEDSARLLKRVRSPFVITPIIIIITIIIRIEWRRGRSYWCAPFTLQS